jgi:predicted enzyme related to lactoylglutathione lyase
MVGVDRQERGMPETPIIGAVVINAEDHDRLVAFWKDLLGVEIAFSAGGAFTWLKPQREGGVALAIQGVPDPTPGRRRVHVDAYVNDVDAAVSRVLELGGSHVEDHESEGFAWKVMADPEGNEFCLVPAE